MKSGPPQSEREELHRAEEELSATARFTPVETALPSELFRSPPAPNETRIVQQNPDSWARPTSDYVHAAVFVDYVSCLLISGLEFLDLKV